MWAVYSCVKGTWYENLDYFSGAKKAKNLSKRHGGRVELHYVEDGDLKGYMVFYKGKCTEKYREKF